MFPHKSSMYASTETSSVSKKDMYIEKCHEYTGDFKDEFHSVSETYMSLSDNSKKFRLKDYKEMGTVSKISASLGPDLMSPERKMKVQYIFLYISITVN